MSCSFRFLLWVSILFLTGASSLCIAVEPDISVRQVIVRAPESRVLKELMANSDDDAMAKLLFSWVADGTATIVSDVSGPDGKTEGTTIRQGSLFKNAVEYDQDFEKGTLIPTVWDDVFIGTSLKANMDVFRSDPRVFGVNWNAFFSPRGALPVKWPAWWPDASKPKVNWFDKHDFYVEKVVTSGGFVDQGTVILGIMRRPDRFDTKAKHEETLDVVMAQINSGAEAKPSEQAVDSKLKETRARVTVLGFGLRDSEALEMLNRADLEHDQNMLDELLARVAAGQAKLRTSCSLSLKSGNRSKLESVREHSYPTEMPTIPSAWEMRPVGTTLEAEYTLPSLMDIYLEQHPALPRRAEWPCALDLPALIMWQPQFLVQTIRTSLSFGKDGVALLGAMRTPDCLTGANELIAGETLLLFAKLEETAPKPGKGTSKDPFGPTGESVSHEPPPPRLELEAVVFELPASEEASWQLDPAKFDDGDRFSKMLARTKNGTAKIVAHLAVPTKSGTSATLSNVEEVMTVTEVDPPRENSPQRYRPTAMDTIPCGTTWEVEPVLEASKNPFDHGALEMHLHHKLKHHVARPIEPTCQQMIESTRINESGPLPKAIVFEEAWEGDVTLKLGAVRCIGVQHPPGDAFKDKLHVAFLRARVAK